MTLASPIKVLFAADGAPAAASPIDLALPGLAIDVEIVDGLSGALHALAKHDFDCVAYRFVGAAEAHCAAVRASHEINPRVPVVVLVDDLAATEAFAVLQAGAADCLPCQPGDGERVTAAIWSAVRAGHTSRCLEQAESRAEFFSLHDGLTGLPNRGLFFDRLDQAVEVALRRSAAVSLLTLDINGFTSINRNLGHGAGDSFLKEVAERLRATLRSSDVLSRIGDDEFAILMPTGA